MYSGPDRDREPPDCHGGSGVSAFYDAYWDQNAEWNQVHPGNRHRARLIIREIRRCLAQAPEGRAPKLIDIGCGNGALLRTLRAACPAVELYAEDISPRAAELAAEVCAAVFVHDLEREPLHTDEVFDLAVLTEVLEHVPQPVRLLRHLRSSLGPSARVIITVPIGPITAFDRQIGHLRHYSLQELSEACALAGYRTVVSYRWGFPFFSLFRTLVWLAGKRAGCLKPTDHGLVGRAAIACLNASFFLCPRSRWLGRQVIAVVEPDDGAQEGASV